jgi:hypothetical protein
MAKKFVFIAGGISLLFTFFHLLFPWLFNWPEALLLLDPVNRAIFETFSLVSILMLLMISFLSFRYPDAMIETQLGRWLCFFFGAFYMLRIGAEFLFFGFSGLESIGIVGLCLIPSVQYFYVFLGRGLSKRLSLQNS